MAGVSFEDADGPTNVPVYPYVTDLEVPDGKREREDTEIISAELPRREISCLFSPRDKLFLAGKYKLRI